MSRVGRIVAKNYPYHVTQQRVFETDNDYQQYLSWLKKYAEKYALHNVYAAIRYVENNPVRAGIVKDAKDYR